jgi:hypothetical protein
MNRGTSAEASQNLTAALSLLQQSIEYAGTSWDLDGLMRLEPFGQIACAAPDRPLAFETREALFVEILFAAALAAP